MQTAYTLAFHELAHTVKSLAGIVKKKTSHRAGTAKYMYLLNVVLFWIRLSFNNKQMNKSKQTNNNKTSKKKENTCKLTFTESVICSY